MSKKAVRVSVNCKKKDGTYMDVESAIKLLRRKMASEDVTRTYMNRRFYKSKGQKAREDKERAIKRYRRKERIARLKDREF